MKWNHKGHQLDAEGTQLCQEFEKRDGVWVFGAGIYGKELKALFQKYSGSFKFQGFIDNNANKKTEIQDCDVLTLQEYMDRQHNDWIIIAAEGVHVAEIGQQLAMIGKEKNHDYFEIKHFLFYVFPIISLYGFHKLYTRTSQICVTERCTLNCKKCAHGCFAVDSSAEDMDIKDVFASADYFFGKFDYVTEFSLLGGEPLLYERLPEVIEYIGTKYRDQIINYTITSNGTILPSGRLMEAMRKYHMMFRLSNYSHAVPRLGGKYEEIKKALEESGVEYRFYEDFTWNDFGFGQVNRKNDKNDLQKTFDGCRTDCREIRKNKYYFCVMARSSAENMGFHVGEDDYFDMESCDNRMHLLEYNLGYSQKGYLDMCNFCHGKDIENYPIPAAEQL